MNLTNDSIKCDDFSLTHKTTHITKNSHNDQLHSHTYVEIYININCKAKFFIEGATFTLNPYDIIIVPPYKLHYILPKEESIFDRIIINLYPALYESFNFDAIKHIFERKDFHNCKIPGHIVRRSNISEITEYLIKHCTDNNPYTLPMIRCKIVELISGFDTDIKYDSFSSSDTFTQNIIEFIDNNTDKNLSVISISEHFSVSVRQLNALFKNKTGLTVNKYINLKKMQMVIDLHQKGHSLVHSCIEAGFSSYEAFAYLYKKEYGTAPKKSLNKFKTQKTMLN